MDPAGITQGPGGSLENSFKGGQSSISIQEFDVERKACLASESRPEPLNRTGICAGGRWNRSTHAIDQARAPRNLNHCASEMLVDRREGMPRAPDPLLVSQRLIQRQAQADGNILGQKVRIGFVRFALDLEVEGAVPGEERQHVIKEGEPRLHGAVALTVKVQYNLNLRLVRGAYDAGLTLIHVALSPHRPHGILFASG
jgi:hypothetical protein